VAGTKKFVVQLRGPGWGGCDRRGPQFLEAVLAREFFHNRQAKTDFDRRRVSDVAIRLVDAHQLRPFSQLFLSSCHIVFLFCFVSFPFPLPGLPRRNPMKAGDGERVRERGSSIPFELSTINSQPSTLAAYMARHPLSLARQALIFQTVGRVVLNAPFPSRLSTLNSPTLNFAVLTLPIWRDKSRRLPDWLGFL